MGDMPLHTMYVVRGATRECFERLGVPMFYRSRVRRVFYEKEIQRLKAMKKSEL
jgi:hypothetical protein